MQMDAEGLHPISEKVEAYIILQEIPSAHVRNISELKSYLGLLSYFSCFLSNLSTILSPSYLLLKDDEQWQWTTEQAKAFEESKRLLLESNLLVHFGPSLEIILACDVSAYGIGDILSHRMPDGSEKPVGFLLCILSKAKKN